MKQVMRILLIRIKNGGIFQEKRDERIMHDHQRNGKTEFPEYQDFLANLNL